MYADDPCLTGTASDLELNSDLEIVHSWLQVNKLTLHVKKRATYFIIASNYRLIIWNIILK